jgi:hypothetical protein
MTVHDLPKVVRRWTPLLKQTMVNAVRSGAISREDLCARYLISDDEWRTWTTSAWKRSPHRNTRAQLVEEVLRLRAMVGGRS